MSFEETIYQENKDIAETREEQEKEGINGFEVLLLLVIAFLVGYAWSCIYYDNMHTEAICKQLYSQTVNFTSCKGRDVNEVISKIPPIDKIK